MTKLSSMSRMRGCHTLTAWFTPTVSRLKPLLLSLSPTQMATFLCRFRMPRDSL